MRAAVRRYISLYLEGGLTLVFPTSVAHGSGGCISLDWVAGSMRYQIDRKCVAPDVSLLSLTLVLTPILTPTPTPTFAQVWGARRLTLIARAHGDPQGRRRGVPARLPAPIRRRLVTRPHRGASCADSCMYRARDRRRSRGEERSVDVRRVGTNGVSAAAAGLQRAA